MSLSLPFSPEPLSGKRVHAIEAPGGGAVPAGPQVIVLQVLVVHLAAVQQLRRCIGGIERVGVAVGIIGIVGNDAAYVVRELPDRAVAVVKEVVRSG